MCIIRYALCSITSMSSTWSADIVVHTISYRLTAQSGAAIVCSECFLHTFLPLSGRERIDLDLGTIKAFGTIQWFTLVT